MQRMQRRLREGILEIGHGDRGMTTGCGFEGCRSNKVASKTYVHNKQSANAYSKHSSAAKSQSIMHVILGLCLFVPTTQSVVCCGMTNKSSGAWTRFWLRTNTDDLFEEVFRASTVSLNEL